MNYELLLRLIKSVPENLDRKQKKEKIIPLMKEIIKKRANGKCELCTRKEGKRTHHIIPNGTANENNLTLLCINCHDAIHILLYTSGKWKAPYIPRRSFFR